MEQQAIVEIDVIRRAQTGNQDAYGELYQSHLGAIYQYINRRVSESGDAEDLTQTVFLKAWQALRDYQPSATPFRAWLYRIAHNTVVDHYRGQKRVRSQGDPLLWDELMLADDAESSPDALFLDREKQEKVQRAIAMLRPSYREIIVRRFVQEQDYAETAAELGHQVNNLRVLQHRALDALRQILTHEIPLAFAIVAMLLLLGRQMIIGTAHALPGERLYPVRIVVEESILFLADDDAEIKLHTQYTQQRIDELRQLSEQGRITDLSLPAQNLAGHIQAATDKITNLATSNPEMSQQYVDLLQQQSTELNNLLATENPTLNSELQPALQAFVAAEATLQSQNTAQPLPSPTPIPTIEATPLASQLVALPTATPTQPPIQATDTSIPLPTATATEAVDNSQPEFISSTATQSLPTPPVENTSPIATREPHPSSTHADNGAEHPIQNPLPSPIQTPAGEQPHSEPPPLPSLPTASAPNGPHAPVEQQAQPKDSQPNPAQPTAEPITTSRTNDPQRPAEAVEERLPQGAQSPLPDKAPRQP